MIKQALIASALLVLTAGGAALADQEPAVPAQPNDAAKPNDDGVAACTAMMSGQGVTTEGSAWMKHFMQSEKMGQAMTGMMGERTPAH